jgi:putative heme-binding domain-containing protein
LASRGDFSQDKKLPLLVWYGIEPSVPKAPEKAVELIATSAMPKVRTLTVRHIFEDLEDQQDAATAVVELLQTERLRSDILDGISNALEGKRSPEAPKNWNKVRLTLLKDSDREVAALGREIDARFGNAESQEALLALISNPRQETASRRRALDLLVEMKFTRLSTLLSDLIADAELSGAAIRAMGALDTPNTAQVLLDRYPSLSASARRQVVHVMTSRPGLAEALVTAIQRGRVPRAEVDASAQRQLRNLHDPELREKLFAIWPQSNASANSRRDLFVRYEKLLTSERIAHADPARGRTVFQQACGVCHKLYGEGAEIGPELTGSDRHNLDYLLENILSPSGIVPENYRASTVTLKDDRVLSGIVVTKAGDSLSVQTATEKVAVPLSEVESIRESELSMMPEGLLDSLSEQQVADLISYLMSNNPPAAMNPHNK